MNLQAMLQEAMKTRNDLARDMLRIVMGEISTRQARTGQPPGENETQGIIRKLIASNSETRKELERRGQSDHPGYERLAQENSYLDSLLPRSLDRAALRKELEPLSSDLKAARTDGMATGLAMKHLKQKGLAVQGEEVTAVVKEMRAV